MKPLALPLAFSGLLVVLLVGWLYLADVRSGEPPTGKRAAVPQRDEGLADEIAPTISLREPVEPALASAAEDSPQEPADDSQPTAPDDGSPELFSEEAMLRKYSEMSLDELRLAEMEIKAKARIEGQRIAKEMLESGDHDERFVRPGERVSSPPMRPGEHTVVWAGESEPTAGGSMVKTAAIEPGTNPAFDALLKERSWLDNYIYEREHDL